ncbi:MAG: phage holin family protein [Candidatus Levybacteria bacterium]|nr:phage holin family protein [Candidatus Levybacteria bacterium]
MKTLIRKTAFNAFALFLLSQLLAGVKIIGGIETLLLGGFILTLLLLFVEPILNIVSLPLTFVTLGLFSFITHAILFYLLTILMPTITVNSFVFQGLSFAGFIVPKLGLNMLFAYILAASVHSVIISFLSWLTKS